MVLQLAKSGLWCICGRFSGIHAAGFQVKADIGLQGGIGLQVVVAGSSRLQKGINNRTSDCPQERMRACLGSVHGTNTGRAACRSYLRRGKMDSTRGIMDNGRGDLGARSDRRGAGRAAAGWEASREVGRSGSERVEWRRREFHSGRFQTAQKRCDGR